MEILCREQNTSADGLGKVEKIKFNAHGQERILVTKLIMNTDRDKYGTLIKDYNGEYLNRNNKYPKTLQDTYNMLKGWNKHKPMRQKHSSKVEIYFNTMGQGG